MTQEKDIESSGEMALRNSSLSATSPTFVPHIEYPTTLSGPASLRTYFAQEDWSKREVLVTAQGVHHNVSLVREVRLPDGAVRRQVEAKSSEMDLLVLLGDLGDAERKEFLKKSKFN